MLWEFANGIGTAEVQSEPEQAKGIGNSTTLSEDAVSEEEVRAVFRELAASVGNRLKKAGQKAGWSVWRSSIMISVLFLIRSSLRNRPMIRKCFMIQHVICFWKYGPGSRCGCWE